MREIVIYVEGGGNTAAERAELRNGLDDLFAAAKRAARGKKLGWKLVPSGGRDQAYANFAHRLSRSEPADTLVVLLVDSEGPLDTELPAPKDESPGDKGRRQSADAQARKSHLQKRDPSWDLKDFAPERIHLMVQCMEAWIVSDPEALAKYYGDGFHAKSLPTRRNLEVEPKKAVYAKLELATRATKKGAYAKIRHASKLLGRIDPKKVSQRCPRFGTFTGYLAEQINNA